MSWASKRQFTYLSVAILILIILVVALFWYYKPVPTCFDNKQNQDEEAIDCGGICEKCLTKTKDLITVWGRVFPIGDGIYEASALLKNPNFLAGAKSIVYRFKIYDASNILIVVKEGETFINPGEEYLIFEPKIDMGKRTPKKVFIEIDPIKWTRIEKEKPSLSVSKKEFNSIPFPSLSAKITNSSLMPQENIQAAAVLYNKEGNVIGVSTTKIAKIQAESSHAISFTWRTNFEEEPSKTVILLRTNLTE